MRRIDFQRLFDEERIPYITRGANVKRGELNIRCPFCGNADPSYHMGVNPDSGYWACWRNQDHRGKSPVRLLVRLLNIPYYQAREMAGLSNDYVDPDGFSEVAARLRRLGWKKDAKTGEVEVEPLQMPRDFRPITRSIATHRHWDYLFGRGFGRNEVDDLCYDYKLMACTSGPWVDRVILPYYLDGDLVTWAGRAIARAELRYKQLAVEESIFQPRETLYNFDCVQEGGEWLIVVEGPIDALKIDFYGKPFGVRAVALSTNSITEPQVYLLADGFQKFKHLGSMMDRGSPTAVVDSMRMTQQLRFIDSGASSLPVPGGRKDAGESTPDEIISFARELTCPTST